VDTQDKGAAAPGGYLGAFLAAMTLTATYVLYGYDTAGTLAEETHEPRRKAPRAILQALCAAGVMGGLLLMAALMSARDIADPRLAQQEGGLPFIINQTLGKGLGTVFLAAVVFAILVCALAVQTSTARLMYAMARDNQLPFSRALAHVSASARTPALANLTVGIMAAGILVVYAGYPRVIEAVIALAVLWANLAYLMLTSIFLVKRLRGWPGRGGTSMAGLFALGRWGLAVNLLAVLWGVFIVINIAWPRPDAGNADLLIPYAPLACTAGLVLLGVGYYGVVQRRKAPGGM